MFSSSQHDFYNLKAMPQEMGSCQIIMVTAVICQRSVDVTRIGGRIGRSPELVVQRRKIVDILGILNNEVWSDSKAIARL